MERKELQAKASKRKLEGGAAIILYVTIEEENKDLEIFSKEASQIPEITEITVNGDKQNSTTTASLTKGVNMIIANQLIYHV